MPQPRDKAILHVVLEFGNRAARIDDARRLLGAGIGVFRAVTERIAGLSQQIPGDVLVVPRPAFRIDPAPHVLVGVVQPALRGARGIRVADQHTGTVELALAGRLWRADRRESASWSVAVSRR